jgi:selenocysteine lyase/cysteine desulfurase
MALKPIDVEKARRETPGCANVLHFNNAGAALMPQVVLDATIEHLKLEAAIGGYEAADRRHEAIRQFYDAAARFVGCQRDEIAFLESATRAWDMVFYSIPFREGDRILTGTAEYSSNYVAFLQVARAKGAKVEVVPDDEHGQLDVRELERRIDSRVKLIALTHVPTNGGVVSPVEEVGKVAHQAGVLYLLDACQSAGQVPLDVGAIGCDMLSATGRKYLRGPRGTGFLYCRKSVADSLEPIFLDLFSATVRGPDKYTIRAGTRRFENWERSYAGKLGLAAAIDYALSWGMDAIWSRVRALGDLLRTRLAAVPGVKVQDWGILKCGIVVFTVDTIDAADVKKALHARKMNVSICGLGRAPFPPRPGPLYGLIRASVHYYNTEEEVERFCAAVAEMR